MYIDKAQLVKRFGIDKLAQLTDRFNTGDIDEDVLNDAITDAENLVNSYISPRYTLPLSQALIDASPLTRYCGDIVIYQLHDDVTPEDAEKRFNTVIKWLRDVQANKASFGEQDTGVATPEGHIKTGQGESTNFDWDGF